MSSNIVLDGATPEALEMHYREQARTERRELSKGLVLIWWNLAREMENILADDSGESVYRWGPDENNNLAQALQRKRFGVVPGYEELSSLSVIMNMRAAADELGAELPGAAELELRTRERMTKLLGISADSALTDIETAYLAKRRALAEAGECRMRWTGGWLYADERLLDTIANPSDMRGELEASGVLPEGFDQMSLRERITLIAREHGVSPEETDIVLARLEAFEVASRLIVAPEDRDMNTSACEVSDSEEWTEFWSYIRGFATFRNLPGFVSDIHVVDCLSERLTEAGFIVAPEFARASPVATAAACYIFAGRHGLHLPVTSDDFTKLIGVLYIGVIPDPHRSRPRYDSAVEEAFRAYIANPYRS